MGLKKYLPNTEENILIYTEIFCAGCKYAELTFSEKNGKPRSIKEKSKEIMDKAVKLAIEKTKFFKTKKELESELFEESKKQTEAIGTHELATHIENFLNQATGLLDIFAKQFLGEIFGYREDWNHKKIIKYIKAQGNLDQEIKTDIEKLLNEDWKLWLKDMIDDRNLHHEANFGLSDMYLHDGKPIMILTRRNGEEIMDVGSYIDIHWQNIFGLVKELVFLSFWAINPALKGIRLDKDYFLEEQ